MQVPQVSSLFLENVSYLPFNAFNVSGRARYFVEVSNEALLIDAIHFAKHHAMPFVILGGGSNVLLTRDIDGLLIRMAISGVECIQETNEYVYLQVGAGVNWDEFVQYCLDHHYYGIENLVLIPGTVGAAPIQNIGAYGVELKDVFYQLKAYDLYTESFVLFDLPQCLFSYRNSIFKKIKDRYIVTQVTLKLNKIPSPVLTDKSVLRTLSELSISEPSPRQLSEIISNIRRSKLPYDNHMGNAGSFFMNPMIAQLHFEKIKSQFPNVVAFPMETGLVKVAAGWLIDQCGWRGFRENNIGVYPHNALVLVNYGNAKGHDILQLANRIKEDVMQKFNIALEIEPRVY